MGVKGRVSTDDNGSWEGKYVSNGYLNNGVTTIEPMGHGESGFAHVGGDDSTNSGKDKPQAANDFWCTRASKEKLGDLDYEKKCTEGTQ